MACSYAHIKNHIIPIITYLFWAEVGGATADVVLSAVPQAPHHECDTFIPIGKAKDGDNGDDSDGNITIYGMLIIPIRYTLLILCIYKACYLNRTN